MTIDVKMTKYSENKNLVLSVVNYFWSSGTSSAHKSLDTLLFYKFRQKKVFISNQQTLKAFTNQIKLW